MALELPVVNNVAVLVAAIVSMVLGAVWFSPQMFGKQWMKLAMKKMMPPKMGKQAIAAMKEEMQKGMMKGYALGFITTLIAAYVLALLVAWIPGTAGVALDGAMVGFWVWLFVAAVAFSSYIWEKEPLQLYLLKIGHVLVTFVVMGAILAAW